MSDHTFSTLVFSGEDTVPFLQAQLTSDVESLTDSAPMRTAWCNPKGRVISLFNLTRDGDQLLLRMPQDLVDTVQSRLTMFRFRAKVTIERGADVNVPESELIENLRAGVAEIFAAQSEKFTAHMLNLDLLNIASVTKGCYPGQEIVARTHFRGATKRRMHRFESTQPVIAGDKVSNGERDIGEVVNAFGHQLLAVIPSDSAEAPLSVGDAELTHIPLPYLQSAD